MNIDQITWLAPHGRTRWWTAVLAAAAVIAAGAGLVLRSGGEADGLSPDVAFSVAGREVSVDELNTRVEVLSALYGVRVPDDSEGADKFRRDAAKSMAISIIMDDKAAGSEIRISDDEAHTELNAFMEKSAEKQAFEDFLSQYRLTEDDVLAEIKRHLAVGRLFTQVTSDVPAATGAEARRRYASDTAAFRTRPARVVQNIVVASRPEAVRVLRRLNAGERFALVAGEFSLDQSTRDQGGLLGVLTRSQLEPDYGQAAFAARVGTLFGPVKSQYGWNIGRVQRLVPARQLTFEQVRERLVQHLTEQRQQQAWTDWVNEAIDASEVQYADAYEPEDPEIDAASSPKATLPSTSVPAP